MIVDALDPEIRRFVTEMSAAWARHGNLAIVTHATARRIAEEVREPWRRGGPRMDSVREECVDHIRVRFYDPDPKANKPILVYLHGGGWTMFSLDTHDRLMREYAARAGVIVAGVDYSLSPEAQYPVALNEVVRVARALHDRGANLAIGGDSAGANLAIAACLRLRDEQAIRAMVLNYGVFDRHSSPEAIAHLGGVGNMLTADEMENYWDNYLRDPSDAEDPFVSPLRADLRGLPPTLLIIPEYDLLTEQSLELARRLEKAGVSVESRIYRGATHSFLEAVSISSLADRALGDTADWLRASLS